MSEHTCNVIGCKQCQRRLELEAEGVKTWHDLVLKYIPGASHEECDHILWSETAFPMGGLVRVEEQIIELAAERAK